MRRVPSTDGVDVAIHELAGTAGRQHPMLLSPTPPASTATPTCRSPSAWRRPSTAWRSTSAATATRPRPPDWHVDWAGYGDDAVAAADGAGRAARRRGRPGRLRALDGRRRAADGGGPPARSCSGCWCCSSRSCFPTVRAGPDDRRQPAGRRRPTPPPGVRLVRDGDRQLRLQAAAGRLRSRRPRRLRPPRLPRRRRPRAAEVRARARGPHVRAGRPARARGTCSATSASRSSWWPGASRRTGRRPSPRLVAEELPRGRSSCSTDLDHFGPLTDPGAIADIVRTAIAAEDAAAGGRSPSR